MIAPDAVVDGQQRFRIAPVVLGDVERAVIRKVHAVPAVALVPHPHRLARRSSRGVSAIVFGGSERLAGDSVPCAARPG